MLSDFHSHILPAVDDGSSSVEESIAMLQTEAGQGIRLVVATPHFYANHDDPQRFLDRRAKSEEQLRGALADYDDFPRLEVAAEVNYFPGISESEELTELSFANGRYLLLEMPLAPWTDKMYREVEAIAVNRGITPIMAHVDRYISPLRTYDIPKRLEQLPVLVQANASFFLKPATRAMALRMLQKDRIHLLGSDCHNMTSRVPNLGLAIEQIQKKLGDAPLERIHSYEELVWG